MNETEIKFRVDDVRALARKLRASGFKLETRRTHEINVLFDLPDGSLRHSGQVFRLRKYGDGWVLTHKDKGTEGRHKVRKETEIEIADGGKLETMLYAIGMKEAFRYEKFRTEWKGTKGKVVVDMTPIGDFAEIEGPARWIDQTARKLEVGTDEYITDSYALLFSKWRLETGSDAAEMTFKAIRRKRRG